MELRDKVARAIREVDPTLSSLRFSTLENVADAAIATVQEAEADIITTLRAEVAALRCLLLECVVKLEDVQGGYAETEFACNTIRRSRALLEKNHAVK